MRMRRVALAGALILGTTAMACGGSGGRAESPQASGSRVPASQSTGPALVVERFLRAANANDLQTMTQLFGTRDRTIVELDGETKAQQRMYVLASVLRHQDWSIQGQDAVPGRMMDATELQVRIQQQDKTALVPFLVVRRDDGGWIIERINIEALTQFQPGG